MPMMIAIGLGLGFGGSLGPDAYAPFPAPAGLRWDFVTQNGPNVTVNNSPTVILKAA